MKHLSLFVLLFGFHLTAFSQSIKESTKVDFIKSIQFFGGDQLQQIPMIRLNESFTLLFDDLLAQDNDYYYRIKYFNHDWTPVIYSKINIWRALTINELIISVVLLVHTAL